MANEIEFTAVLSYLNSAANISQKTLPVQGKKATIAGKNYAQGPMTVPTTPGGTSIPIAGLSAPGAFIIINRSITNFVEVLTAVGGDAILKIPPGEPALGRFASTIIAPAVLADTAPVSIEFLILEP